MMGAGAPQQWTYFAVRLVHLALTTAIIPCGLWYALARHPSLPLPGLGLLWVLSIFVLLFAIPMDQNRYPIGLAGAAMRTGPILLSVGVAVWLHRDLLAGAFFGASALVAGMALFLTMGSIRELARPAVQKPSDQDTLRRKTTKGLLIPFALLAWATAALAVPLLLDGIGGARNRYLGIELGIWALQALSTSHLWFGQSIWGHPDEDARSELYSASWGGFSAGFFTAGFLAVTVAAIWLGMSG